jgi:hypothetical protein
MSVFGARNVIVLSQLRTGREPLLQASSPHDSSPHDSSPHDTAATASPFTAIRLIWAECRANVPNDDTSDAA